MKESRVWFEVPYTWRRQVGAAADKLFVLDALLQAQEEQPETLHLDRYAVIYFALIVEKRMPPSSSPCV